MSEGECMYRVRRITDGCYLHAIIDAEAGNGGLLVWAREEQRCNFTSQWKVAAAGMIGNGMIALTGDHGIEIEPVASGLSGAQVAAGETTKGDEG